MDLFYGTFVGTDMKCSDYKNFSYTTNRQTLSGNNCGSDPDLPNWPHYNGKHRVKKGEYPHCWLCYLWCLSMWRCDTTAVKLQLCEWLETESYFTINGVRLNETVVSLTINPSTDAKYGFWHNDSWIFIRTANWLFMEQIAFNYSCSVTNPNPPCYANHNFVEMNSVSALPLISSCKTLVKIPALIIGANVKFCTSLIEVHNNESDTYGVKSDGPGCMIKVEEDTIQFLWLSEGSYRFFKHIAKIACKSQGNGLYTDCDDGELFPLEVKEMGYDTPSEVIDEIADDSSGGVSIDLHGLNFGDLFTDKTKTIVMLIDFIVIVIAIIIVIIISVCCCFHYCPAK
jgi:hypothetical protein